jgi:nucleoside-diphosphate-sugar epimerase
MKILILGGNRFFGKKLANRLIEDGHTITLLNRQSRDDGFGNRVSRIKCDRTNAADLKNQITENYDVIYDQICYEPKDARAAVDIFAKRTPLYIFTSSQSVYGAGAFLPESAFDPVTYEFTTDSTDYAEAKRQCESVFFHQSKLKVTAIRFPIVCGHDDYTGMSLAVFLVQPLLESRSVKRVA